MADALTPERLAELRRLAEAAREEPWAWQGRNDDVADLPSVVLTRLRATRTPCTWGSCIARDPDKDGALVLSEHACQACSLAWYRWHGRSEASNPAARYLNALSPSAVLALLDRLEAAEARVRELEDEEPDDWETVHACPLDGVGVTSCCGRSPFDLPHTDRLATDPSLVTCVAGEPETVRLTPDELDGGFVAERLDLPGCISQGETEEEALANLADAAVEWLAAGEPESPAELLPESQHGGVVCPRPTHAVLIEGADDPYCGRCGWLVDLHAETSPYPQPAWTRDCHPRAADTQEAHDA